MSIGSLIRRAWNTLSFNAAFAIVAGTVGLFFLDYLGNPPYSTIYCILLIASGFVVWRWPDAIWGLLICVGMATIGAGVYLAIRGDNFFLVLGYLGFGGLMSNWGVSQLWAKLKQNVRPPENEKAAPDE
jgi:hypothetical protein